MSNGESFLEGFMKESSDWLKMMGQMAFQRKQEQRSEERQIRAEGRALQGFRQKRGIQEEFDIRSEKRAQEAWEQKQRELIELNKSFEDWKVFRNKELEAVLYSQDLLKMRKKATTSNDPIAQAFWTMADREIGELYRGEIDSVSPEFIAGLPFTAQAQANKLIFQHNRIKQEHDLKVLGLEKELQQLEVYIEGQKGIQAQREDLGITRGINRLQDLEKPVADARRKHTETKRDLLQLLEEKNIMDSKGRLKIGGFITKNPQLYDSKTGMFNEDVVAQLLERKPIYSGHFEALRNIQIELTVYEAMREQFKKEEPTEEEDTILSNLNLIK